MKLRSADGHLVEPVTALAEFAASQERGALPQLVSLPDGGDAYVVDGIGLTLPVNEILGCQSPATWAEVPIAAWDPHRRVAYQEAAGLGGELLFPTLGLLISQHPEGRYRNWFADTYNRWLAEEWRDRGGGRLEMVALLGRHDTPAVRSHIVRDLSEKSFAGLLLPAEPFYGTWADPAYGPFFSELAEAGLLACFHAFSRPVRTGLSRKAAAVFAASHQAMDLFNEMVLGGILAATPDLRILFGEGETWWLPFWTKKMEEAGADLGAVDRALRVTAESAHGSSAHLVVFANDYPHGAGIGETVAPLALPSSAPSSFWDGSFWNGSVGAESER